MKKILILLVTLLILPNVLANYYYQSYSIPDQGINVRENGVLTNGNLSVYIYASMDSGNLVYQENFTDVITNGSWSVILGQGQYFNITYGSKYFRDYRINGKDINFTNNTLESVPRLEFTSPWGYLNFTHAAYDLETINFSHYHDAANISSGVFNVARIPQINNSHIHSAANITSGAFLGNYTFNGNMTLLAGGNLSLPSNSILDAFINTLAADKLFNLSFLTSKIQLDAANITAGVFALARIPEINNTHTHDAANITAGTLAQARIPDQSNLHTHDAVNVTSGTLPNPRLDTTFVINKNGTGTISNATLYCANISGATSNLCTLTDTNSGGTVTSIATSRGLNRTTITATGTIAINTSETQVRVTGTCSTNQSIQTVAEDGTVTCDVDDVGSGGAATSTIPATNVSSGLFGSSIGNNSFNFTNLAITSNLTLLGTANLSLPTNSILDAFVNTLAADKLFNVSFLNNLITLDAANITSGVFALARIPQINNTHTHDAINITSGVFAVARIPQINNTHTHAADNITAGMFTGNFIFNNFLTLNGTLNITENLNATSLNNKIQSNAANITAGVFALARIPEINNTHTHDAANITAGTLAQARIPQINNTHTHDALNITSGTFALARIPEINNSHTHDATNTTSGIFAAARYDTTFVVNKNGTGFIANATIYCANISGATSNLCTVAGGGSALNVTNDTSIVTQNPTSLNFSSSEFTLSTFGSVARIVIGLLDASKLTNVVAINNKLTLDAQNITAGLILPARENTTFVVNKNGTSSISNATIPCTNITGGPDTDFCTDATGGGGEPLRNYTMISLSAGRSSVTNLGTALINWSGLVYDFSDARLPAYSRYRLTCSASVTGTQTGDINFTLHIGTTISRCIVSSNTVALNINTTDWASLSQSGNTTIWMETADTAATDDPLIYGAHLEFSS